MMSKFDILTALEDKGLDHIVLQILYYLNPRELLLIFQGMYFLSRYIYKSYRPVLISKITTFLKKENLKEAVIFIIFMFNWNNVSL